MTPRVADVLTGAPVVVGPGDSLAQVQTRMRARSSDHAAVVANGRLLGMVAAADLDAARPSAATTLTVQEVGAALDTVAVASVMQTPPAVGFRTPLVEAARLMRDGERSALPVVRGGTVVAVLTVLDVLAWMSGEAPSAGGRAWA